MKLVVKVGGYIFPTEPDIERIKNFVSALKTLHSHGHRMIVVTGGGVKARTYIDAARSLGSDESFCDWVGIHFSRLNALLFISAFGENAYPEVPVNISMLNNFFQTGKIIVMGGLQSGQSTNAVAAIAAETINADLLINATDVDGVYNSDPKLNPDAKKLEEISVKQLLEIIMKFEVKAGGYKLFDLIAAKIVERSRIPTVILNAKDPENIIRAVEGKKIGTRVIS